MLAIRYVAGSLFAHEHLRLSEAVKGHCRTKPKAYSKVSRAGEYGYAQRASEFVPLSIFALFMARGYTEGFQRMPSF